MEELKPWVRVKFLKDLEFDWLDATQRFKAERVEPYMITNEAYDYIEESFPGSMEVVPE